MHSIIRDVFWEAEVANSDLELNSEKIHFAKEIFQLGCRKRDYFFSSDEDISNQDRRFKFDQNVWCFNIPMQNSGRMQIIDSTNNFAEN